jgi:hypothetical protein
MTINISISRPAALLMGACLMSAAAAQSSAPSGPPAGVTSPGQPGPAADVTVLDSVSYAGNSSISSDELSKDSKLKVGNSLSRELIDTEVKRIAKVYSERGLKVAVSSRLQSTAVGHAQLTFRIDEMPK